MSTFLISCGGTGGHLSPGIAIAEGLIERGHQCTLLISNKQVDSRLIQHYSELDYERMPGAAFSAHPLDFLKFAWEQSKSFFKSIQLIRERKPDVVIGFGGFTTVGITLAAFILGVPVVLHEANRHTGKAIRVLSVLTQRVYLPPGVQLKSLPPKTIRHFGYPVRKEVRPLSRKLACQRLNVRPDAKRLLVIGGSQGASVLNKWVLDNFERLGKQGIDVYCVTGLGKCSKGKLEYVTSKGEFVQAVFTPFVDNVAEVLSAADLVVSRAGAGSIAEFSRCGLPSILVPYPYAADDHQAANARYHERKGCCLVIDEANIDNLCSEVENVIFNDWLLEVFHKNLKKTEVKNSLKLIIDDMEALCSENNLEVNKI